MNAITWLHVAGGSTALIAGAVAVLARKGGRMHASAGTSFVVSILVLGVTAAILAQLEGDAGLGLGGILTCYFVVTSWVTARRRDGITGKFEIAACVLAFGGAAIVVRAGVTEASTTPAGAAPLFAFAAICMLAGLGDLMAVLRRTLTPAQRLSRHLWRMCLAFFIATGSFFLGQQDVMPQEIRGSPFLFILAFAPLAAMAFWLARLRFSKLIRRLMPVTAGKGAALEAAE